METTERGPGDVVAEIKTMSGEIRLKIHLANMEARQRFEARETAGPANSPGTFEG